MCYLTILCIADFCSCWVVGVTAAASGSIPLLVVINGSPKNAHTKRTSFTLVACECRPIQPRVQGSEEPTFYVVRNLKGRRPCSKWGDTHGADVSEWGKQSWDVAHWCVKRNYPSGLGCCWQSPFYHVVDSQCLLACLPMLTRCSWLILQLDLKEKQMNTPGNY